MRRSRCRGRERRSGGCTKGGPGGPFTGKQSFGLHQQAVELLPDRVGKLARENRIKSFPVESSRLLELGDGVLYAVAVSAWREAATPSLAGSLVNSF